MLGFDIRKEFEVHLQEQARLSQAAKLAVEKIDQEKERLAERLKEVEAKAEAG